MTDANAMVLRAFDVRSISTLSLRENDYLTIFAYTIGFLLLAGAIRLHQLGYIPKWVRYIALFAAQVVMLTVVFLLLRQAKSFIYFNF
jgi:hypothetical protein